MKFEEYAEDVRRIRTEPVTIACPTRLGWPISLLDVFVL